MEDTATCPICGNKLTNLHLKNSYLASMDKVANYLRRTCTKGFSHNYRHLVDEKTNEVDWLKLSLNPRGGRWVEINYVANTSRIICVKGEEVDYIDIGKSLEPDFPDLAKLKEKVGVYVLFS